MSNRCRVAVSLLLLVAASGGTIAGEPGNGIVGDWLTGGGKSIVRIERTGPIFTGAIVWLKDPEAPGGGPKLDHMNPDLSRRGRDILGLVILSDLRSDPDGNWSGGRIYDPESGKTYRCEASLDGPDRIRLRGFVGFALLGRTEIWRRGPGGTPNFSP
ncbi:MAG TPA: DUF2147 domain-containing protein [Fibrobacteria bacterium]|nr:DUF2147 domain-containing protein [Fibrobacteria bacterium]